MKLPRGGEWIPIHHDTCTSIIWWENSKKLAEGCQLSSKSDCSNETLVLQTQPVQCGDSPDIGSEWWDGAGGFAHSQHSQGRSDVAAFTLKPWRWGGAPACLETYANPESFLHGRMCLFKGTFRNEAQVSFDLRCQHKPRRQKPWPGYRLTPMHTPIHASSLWQSTPSHPIPCYHSSLTYPPLSHHLGAARKPAATQTSLC